VKPLLGIFGGTFDPIHKGHFLVAERLLEKLNFSEIKFIPCKLPVHKNGTHASTEQRVAMLDLALAQHKKLTVDTREIERTTPSYMVETLKSLREDYPDAPLALIMGTDSFSSLHTWRQWQKLTDYAHLIIVKRPGVELYWPIELVKDLKSKVISDISELYNSLNNKLYFFKTETMDVSSTELRQKFTLKADLSSYIPEEVLKYIVNHRVYRP
jgi:nicotinate-nucleotide adenylyltransferase